MPFFILTVALGFAMASAQPVLAQDAAQTDAMSVEDDAPSDNLDDLLWIARPLVVFADSAVDPRFVQQMQMLNDAGDDLADRRVVVLTDTDPAANGPLRQALRPRDFVLVLIDTDGTVVQRRPAPTAIRDLTGTIDRLPSRRQETGSMRR
jgi:hypothetical protein